MHNKFFTPWPHCCLIILVWTVPSTPHHSSCTHHSSSLENIACLDLHHNMTKIHSSPFHFVSLFAAIHMSRPPQTSNYVISCVCSRAWMFSMHTQWCTLPPRPEKGHQSFFTITTFISICLPQMSRHAMVWLHTMRVPVEKRKLKQGSWGHCLEISYQYRAQPCQHQVTLGSRHADGDFSSSGSTCCARTIQQLLLLPCLSVKITGTEECYITGYKCLDSRFHHKQFVKLVFLLLQTHYICAT